MANPSHRGALAMGGRSLLNGMMGMTTSAKTTGEAAGSQAGAEITQPAI